jgi:hypothetical protein
MFVVVLRLLWAHTQLVLLSFLNIIFYFCFYWAFYQIIDHFTVWHRSIFNSVYTGFHIRWYTLTFIQAHITIKANILLNQLTHTFPPSLTFKRGRSLIWKTPRPKPVNVWENCKTSTQSMLNMETNGPRTALLDQELSFYKHFLRYNHKTLGERYEATNVLTAPGHACVWHSKHQWGQKNIDLSIH